MRRLVFVLLATLFAPHPIAAHQIHVPGDQPTIQTGIQAASYGDTVVVACGTYYEHDITMKSGVVLRSASGLPDCVTVDAQSQGRCIYCIGADGATMLIGLTFTGGFADVSWPSPEINGGGVYCSSSDLEIRDCVFRANRTGWWGWYPGGSGCGGGLYCSGGSPVVESCLFEGNEPDGPYCEGGGMMCDGGLAEIWGCTFLDNSAYDGGGLCLRDPAFADVTDCVFDDNLAEYGGGAYCESGSVWSCLFLRNRAFSGGGMLSRTANIGSCTFSDNRGAGGPGGVLCTAAFEIENTIIAFSSLGEAVGCGAAGTPPNLSCCDLHGNAGGDWVGCIADQAELRNNLSQDPLFCDRQSGNLFLAADSPCVSWPGCGRIGALDAGCASSTGVAEGITRSSTWGGLKIRLRGGR